MSAARMAFWARSRGLTRAQIEDALWKDRTLVKTSAMRGTLHLLAATDLPMYSSALRSSRTRQMLRVMARYGVTPKEAEGVLRAVVDPLRNVPMTRRELTDHISALGILGKKSRKWFEPSWWGVVRQAIVEGLICYGPDRGQEVTFIRVDQWLPKQKLIAEHNAGQLLLRHYLRAYGPAIPRDFAKWTGMSMPEVRSIWESLQEELLEISVEGSEGWLLRADYKRLSNSNLNEPVLRLLPNFDSYMLAHAEKDHQVDRRFYKLVYRNAGWISPVVLLNGKAIGAWSLTRHGHASSVEVHLFAKSTKLIRAAIEEESVSLARFLGFPLRVAFL